MIRPSLLPFAPAALTVPAVLAVLAGTCRAQDPATTPPPPAAAPGAAPAAAPSAAPAVERPHFRVRRWPQDRDVPVAIVGGRSLTLGDLAAHIERRHQPGFQEALAKRPEIQRTLTSDLIAPWVRHFADLEALRQTYGGEIDDKALEAAQSEALKQSFQGWLNDYVEERRQQDRPTELTQDQVNNHLQRYQFAQGLAAEVQGTLDLLEPGKFNRQELHAFFTANARTFGGQVTVQHILVQNRDAGTGILLADEAYGLASARLADIKARLKPDGSNFDEVVPRSDDQRTARDRGMLRGLHRHDDRMPAALCRAAWALRDGEVSDVVETPYGWHILKRIEFQQQVFVLFTDDAMPTIEKIMRRARQEERLFQARAKAAVRLEL
ncbi:MAG: peptidylprolyl isomerase [Planctomycetota bacterium]